VQLQLWVGGIRGGKRKSCSRRLVTRSTTTTTIWRSKKLFVVAVFLLSIKCPKSDCISPPTCLEDICLLQDSLSFFISVPSTRLVSLPSFAYGVALRVVPYSYHHKDTWPSSQQASESVTGNFRIQITAESADCLEKRTWKEHSSVSSTLIIAPALSNSPQ